MRQSLKGLQPSSIFETDGNLKPRIPLIRSSDVIAFGVNSHGTDETWCIDTRGVLTLSIDPGTYQSLGLLGTPLPWRPHQDRYSESDPQVSFYL